MQDPLQIWLPILVAAVAVFIASSLIHMVFKWHNKDYTRLPNEDEVRAAIRAGSAKPGLYVLPHCADMKEIQGEPMQKKFLEGPVGFVTLRKNGPPSMGGSLLQWFTFNLIVSMLAGDISLQLHGIQANPVDVAEMVGILSFLTYAGSNVQAGIWMGKPWGAVLKDILDGLIYAVVSGLVFWWLWPVVKIVRI
jgi:hypothetical protein